jgi:hypothetical protein
MPICLVIDFRGDTLCLWTYERLLVKTVVVWERDAK